MIVRLPSDELDGFEPFELIERGGYHSGSIGHEVEREPDAEPRRPIGFRMPEREPVIDPSWMLM